MYAIFTPSGTISPPSSGFNIPTFGSASTKIAPISGTYASGYLPGQGFPAENENYLMYHLSNAVNQITSDLFNIHSEILSVLASQSISTDNTTTQLNTAIQGKINTSLIPYTGLSGYTASNSSGSTKVPINNGTLNSNLNADLLDGIHIGQSGASYIPYANSSGNVLIGTATSTNNGKLIVAGLDAVPIDADTSETAVFFGRNRNQSNMSGTAMVSFVSTDTLAADIGGSIHFGSQYVASGGYANYASIKGGKDNANSGEYGGYLAFGTRPNNTNITERMRITSGGNVLIGQTSDNGNKLQVNGGISANGGTILGSWWIGSSWVNSNNTKLFINNSSGKAWALSAGVNDATENDFAIYNWTDGSMVPSFRIVASSNNVRIPGSLDVAGNVKAYEFLGPASSSSITVTSNYQSIGIATMTIGEMRTYTVSNSGNNWRFIPSDAVGSMYAWSVPAASVAEIASSSGSNYLSPATGNSNLYIKRIA